MGYLRNRRWLRLRFIRLNKTLYMVRFYLGYGWMLNLFVRPDPANEFHDHPWFKATSVHLIGWYREEFYDGSSIVRRAGQCRTFDGLLFHRIAACSFGCLTLFKAHGDPVRVWCFKDADGTCTPHQEFIEKARISH